MNGGYSRNRVKGPPADKPSIRGAIRPNNQVVPREKIVDELNIQLQLDQAVPIVENYPSPTAVSDLEYEVLSPLGEMLRDLRVIILFEETSPLLSGLPGPPPKLIQGQRVCPSDQRSKTHSFRGQRPSTTKGGRCTLSTLTPPPYWLN